MNSTEAQPRGQDRNSTSDSTKKWHSAKRWTIVGLKVADEVRKKAFLPFIMIGYQEGEGGRDQERSASRD